VPISQGLLIDVEPIHGGEGEHASPFSSRESLVLFKEETVCVVQK
jgi:hypothetical protein